MSGDVPSWINKGQPKSTWPEWLVSHAIGRPEPNGSFMIRSKVGKEDVQTRVLLGYVVFERNGVAYARTPESARAALAELESAEQVFAPLGPKQPGSGRPKAIVQRPVPRPAAKTSTKMHPAKGSMPSIEWIQLDRLLVDDSYQRSTDTGPSRSLIARIGREWDWRLCVPLMVSRRPDGLYVIDGQHRLYGARLRRDVPQLPCCISVYESPADEAAMFVAANRERRAMNRLDDFHAAQAGGDKEALAIAAIIRETGFTVARRTGSATWVAGEVAFTAAIAKVLRKHGDAFPRQALKMMADAFSGERLVAGSSIFTAICAVLVSPPDNFDPEQLMKALRTFDMKGWASFLAGAKGGTDRAVKLREMLLAAYEDAGKAVAA
jgi:hypothetical protein